MPEQFSDQIEWTPSQQAVLESQPNLIITGPAGTGKTLLALHLAKKYSSLGYSVALIVFTKALRTFIQSYFSKNKIQDVIVYYGSEWELGGKKQCDIFIMDEFQDFSIIQIEQIYLQAIEGVYILGDDEQRLYSSDLNKNRTATLFEIKKLLQCNTVFLSENHRIPREIVSLINSVYSYDDSIDNTLGVSFNELVKSSYPRKKLKTFFKSTEKTDCIQFANHEAQLEWILNFLKSNDRYKNIGILFKRNDSRFNGYFFEKKIMEERLPGILETYNFLDENYVSVGYKYKSKDNLDFSNDINVNIMTIHSAKGLEFDCVILPFYSWTNKNYDFNLPYVAFSRAKQKLIITYSGIASEDLQLTSNSVVEGKIRRQQKSDNILGYKEYLGKEYNIFKEKMQLKINEMDEFWGEY